MTHAQRAAGLVLLLAVSATLAWVPVWVDAQSRTRARRGAGDGPAFQAVGLGGGGAMFSPTASPHDAKLCFVSCDMGGFYRSEDGGKTWQMVDGKQMIGHTRLAPVFDPKDDERVYMASGGEYDQALKVSTDAGATWTPLTANAPWGDGERITALGVDAESRAIFVGVAGKVFRSRDRGRSFRPCNGVSGTPRAFHFASKERRREWRVFVGTSEGVFRSDDDGGTFEAARDGLPDDAEVRDFCGGSDKRRIALWCVVAGADHGVYRSTDSGESWQRLDDSHGLHADDEYTFCGCAADDPDVCYVTNDGTDHNPPDHWGVYRTTDSGRSWSACYFGDPRWAQKNITLGWLTHDFNYGWGGQASGFGVCPGDSKVLMFTNAGELHISRDGGASWSQGYVTHKRGQRAPGKSQWWASNGLNVTSCWKYAIDPRDAKRHFICYTDIGFARSEDGGETWQSATEDTPWRNTFYDLAFDPDVDGRLIAAGSNTHDIPFWRYVQTGQDGSGGLVVSTDHGSSWKLFAGGPDETGGLPDAPCTSVVIDPLSPARNRTMWVTMYGQGVYRSLDGGASWVQVMAGLDGDNDHYYRLTYDAEHTLYLVVTARRSGSSFPVNGGLYRYDGEKWDPDARRPQPPPAGRWTKLNGELAYPTDVAIHPENPKLLLLCARDVTGGRVEGGIYRSLDGGRTWSRTKQVLQAFSATFSRYDRKVAFATTTDGLLRSDDSGGSWKPVRGLPFYRPTRITEDPDADDRLYVTTFGGGAWRAPVK